VPLLRPEEPAPVSGTEECGMSAKRHRVTREVTNCKRVMRVQVNAKTLELEDFSNESLYTAIEKAAWIASSEGWHDWRLVEGGRVLVTGDEHGPR
jgi:hypothetical protein